MSRLFTEDHEWLDVEGNVATVGITNHAQEQLGDLVFASVPAVGDDIEKGAGVAVVESVKAASDVFAPVSGKIVEVNQAIVDDPSLVNTAAESEGWFFKVELASTADLDGLLDADAYAKLIG